MRKIRVLVVDDSVVIRRLVSMALADCPNIEVVATAPNGRIALSKIPMYNPDLITLDIEMPVMNGLETLAMVRKNHPSLPVIMFSALTPTDADKTLDCLSLGAQDYVTKSTMGSGEAAVAYLRRHLIPKIELFCRGIAGASAPTASASEPAGPTAPAPKLFPEAVQRVDVLVIAASTGGPNALLEIVPQFPEDFPVPILIVQHMPRVFTEHFAKNLSEKSKIRVEEGRSGQSLESGRAWVAPGDYHMALKREGALRCIQTNQNPPENSCRPSADVLFRSAAEQYGPNTLAVVLTGMGQDGLRGSECIAAVGGQIVVQDEASSVVWGMPGFVAKAGLADAVVPLNRIVA
ncbi:MAG TPA: chemotaxis response regulator protein-glutamate methylesterase, partial [Nitrospiria bacterium]|nr:chemotaxis response regulator protein-glutamate methylesterase [Nitrospiria bacterium]